MVHLVSVHDEFHARVITARLGSDGILTEVRPPLGGPYPLRGEVRVYVGEDDAHLARELLRADADQSADSWDDSAGEAAGDPPQAFFSPTLRLGLAVLVLATLLLIALTRAG
jgi:hypothetical protein